MAKKSIKKAEVGELIEEQKPVRYRNFIVLLYEDTDSYNFEETLRIIKSQKKWAYIKHFPESNEKKEHFHCVLSFENAKSKSALAKQINVPENFIDPIKNFRTICRYLIHKDDEEKYQYSLGQVKVSPLFEREFRKQFDDIETEDQIIAKIYEFIKSLTGNNFFQAQRLLVQYINYHVYDRIYKRYRYEFTDYLRNYCN